MRHRLAAALALTGALALITGGATVGPALQGPRLSPAAAAEALPEAPPSPAPQAAPSAPGEVPAPEPADAPVNGVDFELLVPAIGYRATVLEGTTREILDRAPGHYVTSAWPGHEGNVGVAAHNTYWLAFRKLEVGDRVEIQAPRGRFLYEITEIRVVDPDDRTVLAPTAGHRLTLTTCYPLWAGAWATQRLIFIAAEVGGVA